MDLANGCRLQQWGRPVVVVLHPGGQQLVTEHQTAPEMQVGPYMLLTGSFPKPPYRELAKLLFALRGPFLPRWLLQMCSSPAAGFSGVFIQGEGASHVPPNPLAGSGPCRR